MLFVLTPHWENTGVHAKIRRQQQTGEGRNNNVKNSESATTTMTAEVKEQQTPLRDLEAV